MTKKSERVVLIVGASSGIGRATARRFAKPGTTLLLAARGVPGLEETASECRSRGAAAQVVPLDVSDESAVAAAVERCTAEFGAVDVAVIAASVISVGAFEETPPEMFRHILEVNLMGAVHLTRALLPHMRARKRGSLVFVGSVYSRVASPYLTPYITSKFALAGFVESLRQEMGDVRGVRIRLVLPATVDTPIYQHAANFSGRNPHPIPPVVSPHRVARAIARSPYHARPVRIVGRVFGMSPLLHGLSPRIFDAGSTAAMKIFGLRGRPGVPMTYGTVYHSAGESGAVTGGWRSVPVRAAVALAGAAATALLLRRATGRPAVALVPPAAINS